MVGVFASPPGGKNVQGGGVRKPSRGMVAKARSMRGSVTHPARVMAPAYRSRSSSRVAAGARRGMRSVILLHCRRTGRACHGPACQGGGGSAGSPSAEAMRRPMAARRRPRRLLGPGCRLALRSPDGERGARSVRTLERSAREGREGAGPLRRRTRSRPARGALRALRPRAPASSGRGGPAKAGRRAPRARTGRREQPWTERCERSVRRLHQPEAHPGRRASSHRLGQFRTFGPNLTSSVPPRVRRLASAPRRGRDRCAFSPSEGRCQEVGGRPDRRKVHPTVRLARLVPA
jgi:hypothetical protein